MLKKYCIISILLFAYTIVLGHSIIPHHHHHDVDHSTEQKAHRHDDHEDNDRNTDDKGLSHDFENYLHAGDAQDIHQQPDVKVSFNAISTVYLLAAFNFYINADESPPPIVRLSGNHIPVVQHCLSSKGLRAPPCTLM